MFAQIFQVYYSSPSWVLSNEQGDNILRLTFELDNDISPYLHLGTDLIPTDVTSVPFATLQSF